MNEKNAENRLLNLPQGKIKGAIRATVYGEQYYSFEGIPYGKPPIGKLRFKAPVPAENWSEVLDCTACKSKPVQNNLMSAQLEGCEDCLYINVYSKTLNSEKPLPVMVFIYGGAFFFGEATRELYSPDYLINENIILVTFNYRVDCLGFLSLSDPSLEVPGNAGLKDQVLALKWVKENIKHFNGDSENITVFGESAGAASTHFMMLTEQTRDIFQRGILMSGCSLNNWALFPKTDMPYRLAKHHGYDGENVDRNVLEYLRSLESHKLVEHMVLSEEEQRDGYFWNFGPVIEPYVMSDCVIPKSPLEMMQSAWGHRIPMMLGGTSREGLLMYMSLKMFPQKMNQFKDNPEAFLPREVREKKSAEEQRKLALMIQNVYFGNEAPNEKHLLTFIDFYSYSMFWHGLHRTALSRLEYAKTSPTYFYRFDFDSPDFNHYRKQVCGNDPMRGTSHADDLSYVFYSKFAWKLATDSDEYKTINRMVKLWTSFAKCSNPNCDAIAPSEWKPLSVAGPFRALNISNEVEVMDLPEKAKLEAWNSLYEKVDLF